MTIKLEDFKVGDRVKVLISTLNGWKWGMTERINGLDATVSELEPAREYSPGLHGRAFDTVLVTFDAPVDVAPLGANAPRMVSGLHVEPGELWPVARAEGGAR